MTEKSTETPLRKQYLRIKQKYPDVIVFFRLGDFYETFDDDARITSSELDIVLTAREMGKGVKVPLAGIPYHAVDNYLARLIGRGYKVAICEQLTPPGKGLVERDVIRVITPGTLIEPGLLSEKSNNFLASIIIKREQAGIAYADISTGEFAATQVPEALVADEIARINPAEIIVPAGTKYDAADLCRNVTVFAASQFETDSAEMALLEHFAALSLEAYGCAGLPLAVGAAGAIIRYLHENQRAALALLTTLSTYSTSSYMTLDTHAVRNLELYSSLRWGTPQGSLLEAIDLTRTSMGGRMLKKMLSQPLLSIEALRQKQDLVDWFLGNTLVRAAVIQQLISMPDVERIINRVRGRQATPRDLTGLRTGLEKAVAIQSALSSAGAPVALNSGLRTFPETAALISEAISDEPPANFDHGGIIRKGFSEELDKVRVMSSDAKQFLAGLEKQEKERTGIKSLKLGYNRVFGYYIEVSQSNLAAVPPDYIRRQTLAGGERYYTPQLKEYESLILNARERMIDLEKSIFTQVCQQICEASENILALAAALAFADVLSSLAEVAARNGYVKPKLTDGDTIVIRGGRHPVVERALGKGSFIANDTELSINENQLIVLTGPNMAGKSTYLKQVALIVLLAQIGSFVPADEAVIGLVDRIFTRLGAQEDIAAGQSTFMVEMIEVANILNHATPRSLLILDEVGRGTSTYDGLSIAWAVIEYLHNHARLRSKTLFATHYHELVQLAGTLPRVKNFNMAVMEESGKVIFLRKVLPGGADRSYGIHVAQLAGLPKTVIHRAEEILLKLEEGQARTKSGEGKIETTGPGLQLSIFGRASEVEEEIKRMDVDAMSPIEAINKLYQLRRKVQDERKDA